jgi:hypothetical protein
MPPQIDLDLLSPEDRIILALEAMRSDALLSERRAAEIYQINRRTLSNRRAGMTSRRDTHPNLSKLTKPEEESLVLRIKDLSLRGFAPSLAEVRSMADQLLAIRHGSQVGECWVQRFISRQPEIKSQLSRPRDYRRILCSNPLVIEPWFDLVANVKAKYGILDEDTYNFDETGFQIGVGGSVKVVTASEIRLNPIGRQAGDREWITLIAAVGAGGWLVPPFFIFKGKNHNQSWYHNNPKDWRIAVSDNGWTTNEVGVAWLQHFIEHTTSRTVGGYRLLILDGHESHNSIRFQDICKDNNIITLCMPAHASHLLQPLDVGCFSPLKRAYKKEIRTLANSCINRINKIAFLAAFTAVYQHVFSSDNIKAGFKATGLVPADPGAVLSKLEIKPRTPSPPLPITPWNPRTPSNAVELEAQSTLIKNYIQTYTGSSPTALINMVQQMEKGAAILVHSGTLLASEVLRLQAVNAASTERNSRKRKRIQKGGTLSQEEADDIKARREALALAKEQRHEERRAAGGSSRGIPHCRICGEPGHNKRTCTKDLAALGD